MEWPLSFCDTLRVVYSVNMFLNACSRSCTAVSVAASIIWCCALIFGLANDMRRLVAGVTRASITVSVSSSERCAFSPSDDAVISATGLLENSQDDTVQSIAFFNVPGTPIAYSGVQISMPSALRSCWRRWVTASGGVSVSRSGLKCGSVVMRSLLWCMVKPGPMSSVMACI